MVHTKESISSKNHVSIVIWFIVLVCSLIMACYQCWSIMELYFEYPVLQQREFIANDSLQFPAVTLCSNNPVNWPLVLKENHSILKIIEDVQENGAPGINAFVMLQEPIYALLYALQNISVAERIRISTTEGSLGITCAFGPKPCVWTTKAWRVSNSLFYGNCYTFNHAFDVTAGETLTDIQSLSFSFTNELRERMPNMGRKPTAKMAIHPVGTAPVLRASNFVDIYPGDNVGVLVDQVLNTRLPAPYTSKCVDSTAEEMRMSTAYYRPYSPYIYSVDACLLTCIQKLRIERCHCASPEIPIPWFHNNGSDIFPMCTVRPNMNTCYTEYINATKCKCHLPCRDTKLAMTVTTTSIFDEEALVKTYNDLRATIINGVNAEYVDNGRLAERKGIPGLMRSVVTVQLKSSIYEKITEVPKVTESDFLGIIGGNIGLWLGISVMSIYDIIEFITTKLCKSIKSLCRCNGRVQVNPVEKYPSVLHVAPLHSRENKSVNVTFGE